MKPHVDSAIAADKAGLVALLVAGLKDSEGLWPYLTWLLVGLTSRGIALNYPTGSLEHYMGKRVKGGSTFSHNFCAGLKSWLKRADSIVSLHGIGGGQMIVVRYSIQQLCLYLNLT